MRCFAGRVFDIERGAWVSCERCSGTGRVVAYPTSAKSPSTVAGVIHSGRSPIARAPVLSCCGVGVGRREWLHCC